MLFYYLRFTRMFLYHLRYFRKELFYLKPRLNTMRKLAHKIDQHKVEGNRKLRHIEIQFDSFCSNGNAIQIIICHHDIKMSITVSLAACRKPVISKSPIVCSVAILIINCTIYVWSLKMTVLRTRPI